MFLNQESTAEFLKTKYSNLNNSNVGLLLNNVTEIKNRVETRFEQLRLNIYDVC